MNGEVLAGRYRLLTLLGRGGAGEVWQAEDTVLARQVAVKLLRRLEGDPMDAVERFRAEAQAAARLTHPNVVATYDVGSAGEHVFLVMELVSGPDLAQLMRSSGSPERRTGRRHRHSGCAGPGRRSRRRDRPPRREAGQPAAGPGRHAQDHRLRHRQECGQRDDRVWVFCSVRRPTSRRSRFVASPPPLPATGTPSAASSTNFSPARRLSPAPTPTRSCASTSTHPRPPVTRTDVSPQLANLVIHLLAKDPADRPSSAAEVSDLLTAPPVQDSTEVLPLPPSRSRWNGRRRRGGGRGRQVGGRSR